MPADVVAKLNDAVTKAVQLPDVQKSFATFGVIPKTATAARVGEMTAEEVARWSQVIRDNNIRSD
jgi:tripartite-type tricarboxylate transporter receptor subunit TctC